MPPRPRKPSSKLPNVLLDALSFLGCVTKDVGSPYETHILFQNKTAVAYNDILSAGVRIEEELNAAPNASILHKAISKCGDTYSLTINENKIIVKSGSFKATVPCIDATLLGARFPDQPCAVIDDRLKTALTCIDVLKPEPNAQKVHLLAFLLNGQSVVTTDGKIIIEHWHGINLPIIAIPKSIIPAILNNPKKLTQFGFSSTSVTFYFEDNSWVKSQLYAEPFPLDTLNNILNKNSNPSAIPVDFFKALDAIVAFSENGSVYFERDKLCSHRNIETGATFDVPGLPKGPIYTAKYLAMLRALADKIDFGVSANGSVHSENHSGHLLFFFGKQCRGVVAGHG